MKAHLRRTQGNDSYQLQFEDLTLNGLTREVYRGSQLIELTAKKFDWLDFMLRNPRQLISRDRILEKVWGYDFMGESNIIEVYIRALRIKLEASNSKRLLPSVGGVRYVLREQK
ncbi:winged helix-turn-helix domain-containing protein [Microcoleus sp. MON2_D5]|uniref:winged helix-turn-helix domain-containing protein n=1 Tax=Microcoleus sp. MON2_D5 TaxID=2818833 RepID=UPI002FD50BF3